MDEIKNYSDFLNSESRRNLDTSMFPFDVDTFENLIDSFTPPELFPQLLRCERTLLDKFCEFVYHMKFDEAYSFLLGVTELFSRKAIKGLACVGNNTALKIMSEHFLGYKDSNNNANLKVTFVNDLVDDAQE